MLAGEYSYLIAELSKEPVTFHLSVLHPLDGGFEGCYFIIVL